LCRIDQPAPQRAPHNYATGHSPGRAMRPALPATRQAAGVPSAWSQPSKSTHKRPRRWCDAGPLRRQNVAADQKAGAEEHRNRRARRSRGAPRTTAFLCLSGDSSTLSRTRSLRMTWVGATLGRQNQFKRPNTGPCAKSPTCALGDQVESRRRNRDRGRGSIRGRDRVTARHHRQPGWLSLHRPLCSDRLPACRRRRPCPRPHQNPRTSPPPGVPSLTFFNSTTLTP
jgi:hypothetical protein